MTVREFIATIRNDFNAIRLDDYISGEYIYWKGVNIVQFFINRNIKNRKLLNNSSLFLQKNCVELEPYNCQNCTHIPYQSGTIMRSKQPLPKMFQTDYGELLGVYSIDNSTKFNKTNPSEYSQIQKRRFVSKNPYYYLSEDYLYIPNSTVEVVNLLFLTFDLKMYNSLLEGCNSLLDIEFPCPSFLLAEVIEKTKESLLTSKQITVDEDSDLNLNKKT